MKFTLRRIVVPIAVAFAILVPAIQASAELGLSAGEFARDGQSTLRAAGYAFSIWGVIYASLIAYAAWQALPRNAADPTLDRIAGPASIAVLGCGLWIIASSADWKWASVAIIVTSAATLTLGLIRIAPDPAPRANQWLVWGPLSLLAGWLTIASAINIATVLTAEGLIDGTSAVVAGYLGVAAVLSVGLVVLSVARLLVYAVPIAWGLVAVWVAEKPVKAELAVAALLAAGVIGIYATWRATRKCDPQLSR